MHGEIGTPGDWLCVVDLRVSWAGTTVLVEQDLESAIIQNQLYGLLRFVVCWVQALDNHWQPIPSAVFGTTMDPDGAGSMLMVSDGAGILPIVLVKAATGCALLSCLYDIKLGRDFSGCTAQNLFRGSAVF